MDEVAAHGVDWFVDLILVKLVPYSYSEWYVQIQIERAPPAGYASHYHNCHIFPYFEGALKGTWNPTVSSPRTVCCKSAGRFPGAEKFPPLSMSGEVVERSDGDDLQRVGGYRQGPQDD